MKRKMRICVPAFVFLALAAAIGAAAEKQEKSRPWKFLQLGILGASSFQVNGLQLAPFVVIANKVNGLSLAITNFADKVNGYQPVVIGSIARETNGLQTALFTMAKKLDGVQLAAVNVCGEVEDTCFQMGLVNVATKKRGVQLGLVNIIRGGRIPFLPFFNLSY